MTENIFYFEETTQRDNVANLAVQLCQSEGGDARCLTAELEEKTELEGWALVGPNLKTSL